MDSELLKLKREVNRLQEEIYSLNLYIKELKDLTGFWY